MICLGNICRSPTAQGVLSKLVASRNLEDVIIVDSAGTGSWHLGESPDSRSMQAASLRGYDLSKLKARQISDTDFSEFDYLLAMDKSNLSDLKRLCPDPYKHKLQLLLNFGSSSELSVPDPYYNENSSFEIVLDLIEDACKEFIEHIMIEHKL